MAYPFDRETLLGKAIRPHVERALYRSLRRSLRAVYLKGGLPKPPFVFAMNHHSFFDGHLVWFLFKVGKIRGSLLVSEENLRAFPVLRSAGALDAHRLREALRRLRSGETVAVFPEGEMRPAGPLGPLKPGAVWLAKKAGVLILPAASRVWLRGFEHPEAFLLLGEPIPPDEKALEENLGDLLSALDELYFSTHPREVLPGFHPHPLLPPKFGRAPKNFDGKNWPTFSGFKNRGSIETDG